MGVVWNYIRCIHRSRSAIWTQTNWVWWNSWIRMRWYVVMWIVVSCLDEGVVKFPNKNNTDDFDVGFILPHPLKYII